MILDPNNFFSTFSIVAHDPATGQFGVAVQSHVMSVGAAVPFLLPGIGAVATQSVVNISFGPLGLEFLKAGYSAERVIAALVASDAGFDRRQVAVIDDEGRAAAHTGERCIAYASHQVGEGYSVQANMMTNDTVVPAMAHAFEGASGDLAARMMAALDAAQGEDGDIRGMQSAALRVVSGDVLDRSFRSVYDLRVDEHPQPLTELARLVRLRGAQLTSQRGNEALANDEPEQALELWTQAREQAPELEEIAFWQAMTLIDATGDAATAAEILRPALAGNARRDHWFDLITRLIDCGLVENGGVAAQVQDAL